MKSKFEKTLKKKIYASAPDSWDKIKDYAEKEMPQKIVKRNSFVPYISVAACFCFTVIVCVALNRHRPVTPELTSGHTLTEKISNDNFEYLTQNASSENNHSDASAYITKEATKNYFYIPYVVWGESDKPGIAVDAEESELESLDNGIKIHYKLSDTIEKTEPYAEFAVVVKVDDNTDYYKKFPQLVEREQNSKDKLDRVAEKIIEEYMSNENLSYSHANTKMFKNPEFIEAREDHFEALEALETAVLIERYKNNEGAIQELEKHGLRVLYVDSDNVYLDKPADAKNENYQPYLAAYDAVAIMLVTKQELSSLEKKELENSYTFYSAAKNAGEYEYTDKYSYSEVELSNDCDISVKLLEAFEASNGEPLRVEVQIGYYGEELSAEEIEEAAFAEIGMTRKEFETEATVDDLNRYREAFNRLTYHTDYYEEIANRLFKHGEVVEVNAQEAVIIADLTFERVNEIVDNKEVVYVCLENEKSFNSQPIIEEVEI